MFDLDPRDIDRDDERSPADRDRHRDWRPEPDGGGHHHHQRLERDTYPHERDARERDREDGELPFSRASSSRDEPRDVCACSP